MTPGFKQPEPCGLPKRAVDDIAGGIAGHLSYRPGMDLEQIVRSLGGRISIRPIAEVANPSSGSVRIHAEGNFEIVLASHTGPIRDRFTIGHELGHYFLHYLWHRDHSGDPGPIEAERFGSGRVEWEANWFSAGFLMPSAQFKLAHAEHGQDLFALSELFQVSYEAARIRVETLKLG